MKLQPPVKEFIEEYIDLIDNNRFEELYSILTDPSLLIATRDVTDALLEVGIDPLDYMTFIPEAFARGSRRSMSNYKIPTKTSTIDKIYDYAFSGTDIEEFIIPEGVQLINNRVFLNCSYLTKIYLPSTLRMMGTCIFSGCGSLYNIYYNGTMEQWKSISKRPRWLALNHIMECTIHCTDGDLNSNDR